MPVIIKISGNSISITTEEVISGPNRAVKQGVLQEKSYILYPSIFEDTFLDLKQI